MIWGVEKLLNGLRKDPPIVEGLSEDQRNIEGAEFDLRLGEILELEGEAHIGVNSRNTPKVKKLADIKENGEGYKHIIKPNDYVLVITIEKVNCPDNVYIDARPRSTLHRSGLLFIGTMTGPGYHGKLTFAIKNLSNNPVAVELGARFVKIIFHEIEGKATKYTGVWQGGKINNPEEVRPF